MSATPRSTTWHYRLVLLAIILVAWAIWGYLFARTVI